MAKTTTIRYVDDLDGSEAAESIRFSLDRGRYVIDLNEANAAEFRELLARYIAVAAIDRDGPRIPAAKSYKSNPETAEIREWANKLGYKVAPRGRIPAKVLRAYLEENGKAS